MRYIALLLALWLSTPARAGSIDFRLAPLALAGSGQKPMLIIQAAEDADEVVIELARDDGKKFTYRTGHLKGDTVRQIGLDSLPGRKCHFTGTIESQVGKELRSIEVDFTTEVVLPAQLSVDRSKVDLAGRTLQMVSTRDTAKIEMQFTGDQGENLGKSEISFTNAPAGSPLAVNWKPVKGTLLRIGLRVWDTNGFYADLEMHPWYLNIPHQEVHFASNSYQIDAQENPKLDQSLQAIAGALAKHGRWAKLKLYIVGHTDTVGTSPFNRELSLQRAKAIGKYFCSHGLKVPVFYEGFGEEALRVPTPDETDEIQNRRVEYIVGVEPPLVENAPAAAWKVLQGSAINP